MKTRLTMAMPEALSEARPVEITAVAVVSENEMRALFTEGKLPEWLIGRMNQYTGPVMERPGSSNISSYKAMLVVDWISDHGIAVCGQDRLSYVGNFPNAEQWLNRRITQMADQICSFGHAPGGAVSDCVTLRNPCDILHCVVTSDNCIGDMLIAELESRDQVSRAGFTEDGLEIHYDQRYMPPLQQEMAGFCERMRKIMGADESKIPQWIDRAWELAGQYAEDSSVPQPVLYPVVLREYAQEFERADRAFVDVTPELFNYKAAYRPNQLYKIVEWICEGGSAEDAYDLWGRPGSPEMADHMTTPADEEESSGMTMQ